MRSLLTLVVVALVAACTSATPGARRPADLLSADTVASAHLVGNLDGLPRDTLHFEDVAILGDTLTATVSFGGGCADHTFALAFAGAFMESDPVQLRGVLAHDAHGDRCRALLSRTLRFDLRPLREAWRAAYRQESGTIVLQGNWPQPLRYTF